MEQFSKMQLYKLIYKIKKNIKEEVLCENLPKEFCYYLKYVKNLKFEEDPDYNYLRWLFLNILESMQYKNDLLFSWNLKVKKQLNKSLSMNNIKLNYLSRRKESSHKRILKYIQNMQEKEKENSDIKQYKLENKIIKINNQNNLESSNKKEEKDNKNDNWSKDAKLNMDIIIDDSDEDKFNNNEEKNKINSNIDSINNINITKFQIKNYFDDKYKSNIKKLKRDKINKKFLTENNSFQKMDFQLLISNDKSKNKNMNYGKNNRINKINNLEFLDFKVGNMNNYQKINIINNNQRLSNPKGINIYNNTFKYKKSNIITDNNTINELSSNSFNNKEEIQKQIKSKYYKNIFSRKNMSLKNININNNLISLRKNGTKILHNNTNFNKKESNIESYAHKGKLINNESGKEYNFILLNSKNKNENNKSRNNETFTNTNINFINSEYQSVIKSNLFKNLTQLSKDKREKNKRLNSDLFLNNVENNYKFLDKGKNKLSYNNILHSNNNKNIEIQNKFIYQTPKNLKIHKKNLSQINNTYSNDKIENNFIFPINDYSTFKRLKHSNINS